MSASQDQSAWEAFVRYWSGATGRPLGALTNNVWDIVPNEQRECIRRASTAYGRREAVHAVIFDSLLKVYEAAWATENSESSSQDSSYGTSEGYESCDESQMEAEVGDPSASMYFSGPPAQARRARVMKRAKGTAEDPIDLS
mgnify:CR=1 FL=1